MIRIKVWMEVMKREAIRVEEKGKVEGFYELSNYSLHWLTSTSNTGKHVSLKGVKEHSTLARSYRAYCFTCMHQDGHNRLLLTNLLVYAVLAKRYE